MNIIFKFLLFIDGIIYNIIDWIYDIFNFLVKVNLFKEETYTGIVQRLYVVLGMVMLFVLAYSLLKAVVNPETFSKGEQSFPKLIQNVIVSLVIIVLLPTVFSVAYNIQNTILNYDTIPKLILGTDESQGYTDVNADKADANNQGKRMALYIFTSVFHESEAWCNSSEGQAKLSNVPSIVGESPCAEKLNSDGFLWWGGNKTLKEMTADIKSGNGDFTGYGSFSDAAANGKIEYFPIISTIVGAFTAYVLVNYCFDMALRVIKLMFFQIIAPIPVVCRILPGGKMKDVFSTWVKKTLSTFAEVFIRIAIIYLGVFLINQVDILFTDIPNGGLSFTQLLIAKVLVIMGVVIFIRQAPKLIADMFHLDSGSMKLGIMDKLAMGGALTAGAAVGGLVTGAGRNAVTAGRNVKNAKGFLGKAGAVFGGIGSTIAGGASAGARAGYAGKGAKNFGDVKTASAKGATGAANAKAKRDNYKARVANARAAGENVSGLGLRIQDKIESVGQHFGFDSLDDLKKEQAAANKMAGVYSDLKGAVADDRRVRNAKTRLEERLKEGMSDTTLDEGRYKAALVGKFKELKAAGHTDAEANALAKAQINKDAFQRKLTAEEFKQARVAYDQEIEALQYQVDFAEFSAINDDIETKYREQAGTYNRLIGENAAFEWAQGLKEMKKEEIPKALQDAMDSGDNVKIIEEFKKFKDGAPGYAGFFSDSKNLKKASGDIGAKIATKREQQAKENK